MRSVSKQQMVDSISNKLMMQKADIERIMNAFIEEIKTRFLKGQRIEIHHFGTFFPYKRKPRKVISPSDGKVYEVKAKTVLKFKTSKHIKD